MYLVKDIIPGAGKNWTIPPVMERSAWLTENTEATFKLWWAGATSTESLFSDEMCISFESEVDATAYTLKWLSNGNNK